MMKKSIVAMSFLAVSFPTAATAQSLLDAFEKVIGIVSPSSSNPTSSRSESRKRMSDGTNRYDVSAFDVAGVRLGMSPAEVRAALIEKGFTISDGGNVATFQDAVNARARQLNRPAPTFPNVSGPGAIKGYDADRNQITVEFFGSRDSIEVSGVYLNFDGKTVAASQIWRDLKNKYGTPSADNFPVSYIWCDKNESVACGPMIDTKAPKLAFNQIVLGFTLELSNYMVLKTRQETEISALFPSPDGRRQRGLLGGS